MIKLLLGFVLGAAMSAAVCGFWILPAVARDKFEFGATTGRADSRVDIADKIRQTLGDDFDRDETRQSFYDIKDISVVVVTRNGAKTLRVYK